MAGLTTKLTTKLSGPGWMSTNVDGLAPTLSRTFANYMDVSGPLILAGGQEVPSSNLGSPTTKPLVRAGAPEHRPFWFRACKCMQDV
jgi:hypothetical protein